MNIISPFSYEGYAIVTSKYNKMGKIKLVQKRKDLKYAHEKLQTTHIYFHSMERLENCEA